MERHNHRDGNNQFTPSLESAERAAEAARLYLQYRNYQRVADEMGYATKGAAWRAVQRARLSVMQEPALELIRTEAAELDELYTTALEILERQHPTVSHGRIVKDDDGAPLPDDGPRLAALRELRAIRESYRKLLGVDAPSKVSVDAENLGSEISSLLDRLTGSADDTDD